MRLRRNQHHLTHKQWVEQKWCLLVATWLRIGQNHAQARSCAKRNRLFIVAVFNRSTARPVAPHRVHAIHWQTKIKPNKTRALLKKTYTILVQWLEQLHSNWLRLNTNQCVCLWFTGGHFGGWRLSGHRFGGLLLSSGQPFGGCCGCNSYLCSGGLLRGAWSSGDLLRGRRFGGARLSGARFGGARNTQATR